MHFTIINQREQVRAIHHNDGNPQQIKTPPNTIFQARMIGPSSPSPSSHTHTSSFLLISYNILAQSLGSNCIPWVTRISDEWKNRLDNNSSKPSSSSFKKDWSYIKSKLGKEYKRNFHKNPYTQSDPKSYHDMRRLWSAKSLLRQQDLERGYPQLNCVEFHSPCNVSYLKPKRTQKVDGENEMEESEYEQCVATTLRGVLQKELGEKLGCELFQHLMELEENVFDWKMSRGRRVFRNITSKWTTRMIEAGAADEEVTERGSNAGSNSDNPPDLDHNSSPSIICLQEYDVHASKALYRRYTNDAMEEEEEETFAQAMKTMGYDGFFFQGSSGKSGVATFWKRDEFQLDILKDEEEGKGLGTKEKNESDKGAEEDIHVSNTIPLGTNWKKTVFNYDLMEEYCHRSSALSSPPQLTLLNELDRKNVGFLRLKHVHTNRILWVFNVHLMTTSRDNKFLTFYPGEIRSREIATISNLVKQYVNENSREDNEEEDVILAGDWNTDVGDLSVFKGCIPLGEMENEMGDVLPSMLNIPTGFCVSEEESSSLPVSYFDWQIQNKSVRGNGGGGAILRDAFESVHGRTSHSVNPAKASISSSSNLKYDGTTNKKLMRCHATSHNSDRREWIDHIWYSGGSMATEKEVQEFVQGGKKGKRGYLDVKKLSHTKLPWKPIPDEEEPSDHIPIGVEFEFV